MTFSNNFTEDDLYSDLTRVNEKLDHLLNSDTITGYDSSMVLDIQDIITGIMNDMQNSDDDDEVIT